MRMGKTRKTGMGIRLRAESGWVVGGVRDADRVRMRMRIAMTRKVCMEL